MNKQAQDDATWVEYDLEVATARAECDRAQTAARAKRDRALATAWAEKYDNLLFKEEEPMTQSNNDQAPRCDCCGEFLGPGHVATKGLSVQGKAILAVFELMGERSPNYLPTLRADLAKTLLEWNESSSDKTKAAGGTS